MLDDRKSTVNHRLKAIFAKHRFISVIGGWPQYRNSARSFYRNGNQIPASPRNCGSDPRALSIERKDSWAHPCQSGSLGEGCAVEIARRDVTFLMDFNNSSRSKGFARKSWAHEWSTSMPPLIITRGILAVAGSDASARKKSEPAMFGILMSHTITVGFISRTNRRP